MTERRTEAGPVDEPDEPDTTEIGETETDIPNVRDESESTSTRESTNEFENTDTNDESTRSKPGVPEPLSTPVQAGAIDAENAAFVVLGALATVALFVHLTGVAL